MAEELTETTLKPSKEAEEAFHQHSIIDPGSGEESLSEEEFIDALAPPGEDFQKTRRSQYAILFRIADRQSKGRVNLLDWTTFENLLAKPDAEYEVAFRLFDVEGTGRVRFDDFKRIYDENKGDESIPFDWDSGWASLYIGGKKHRHDMTYLEFSQMMRGLQGERIRQAFQHFDKSGNGYIEPQDFQRIVLETASHKLSNYMLESLPTLCNISAGTKISYANVRAFQNVIREMDLIELVIRSAIKKSPDRKITRTDFLNEAARTTRFSLITPMEADILFHFASIKQPSRRLGLEDFTKVLDASWQDVRGPSRLEVVKRSEADHSQPLSPLGQILHGVTESAHHFVLGSLAGAFGAFSVYPIDLVKTRMQNQRSQRVGQLLYKNSLECASKVIKNEGFKGLYSGIVPQLVGVAPEKAIKLTVNDLVRGALTDSKTGQIWWVSELIAGGSAGACQVVFTNPLEIVKIRLQVQGEASKATVAAEKKSATWIIRNLGLKGLYKGASACLLRDVPFSAIYFPTYNHLKRNWFGEGPTKKLGVLQLLTAGAVAGMPAAYLTTPCDVIKTRLQVETRKGETQYTTLRHCAKTILEQEGFRAFFKGGPARVLRSSPQFGFTLAGYEFLQRLFPMSGGPGPSGKDEGTTANGGKKAEGPMPYVHSRNALKIILDIDQNFGRMAIPDGAKPTKTPGIWKRDQGA